MPASPTAERRLLLAQLPLTLGVLALAPSNTLTVVGLCALWAVTFRRLGAKELRLFLLANVIFVGMDAASVKQGVFAFTAPDALGLPAWEFLMWGFYLLHATRLLQEDGEPGGWAAWLFAALFALCFPLSPSDSVLLASTGVLLGLALLRFHRRGDLAMVLAFVAMGAAVEAVGVHGGLWRYPGDPALGFPPWFATMWGGVGLLTRRLFLPLVSSPRWSWRRQGTASSAENSLVCP